MRDERFPGSAAAGETGGSGTVGGPDDPRLRSDRLQALLDALPVGVFTVDSGGSILCLNDEAARLSGVDALSSRGRPCAQVFRCAVCGPVCLAKQARRRGRFDRALPTDVRGSDGTVRSVAVSSRALSGGEVAITLRDVTVAERLRRDLETRAAPAEAGAPAGAPATRDAAREQDTRAALHRAAGNVTIAARLLGVHRTTLWRRMCSKGLHREQFHPGPPGS
jgi:PAS domain S-box-containing protein